MNWAREHRAKILEALLAGRLPDGFCPEDLPKLGEIAGGKLSLKVSPKGHLQLIVSGGSRYGHTLYLREALRSSPALTRLKLI